MINFKSESQGAIMEYALIPLNKASSAAEAEQIALPGLIKWGEVMERKYSILLDTLEICSGEYVADYGEPTAHWVSAMWQCSISNEDILNIQYRAKEISYHVMAESKRIIGSRLK